MSIQRELLSYIEKANKQRIQNMHHGVGGFYSDNFCELNEYILKVLNYGSDEDKQVIADNMDIILPFLVNSNFNKILCYKTLVMRDGFREKFGEGLKIYPYKEFIIKLFYSIGNCYSGNLMKFLDRNMLEILSSLQLDSEFNSYILKNTDDECQEFYLKLIIENGGDFSFSIIHFSKNTKQFVLNNIDKFLKNYSKLYSLRNFVKDDYTYLNIVKNILILMRNRLLILFLMRLKIKL